MFLTSCIPPFSSRFPRVASPPPAPATRLQSPALTADDTNDSYLHQLRLGNMDRRGVASPDWTLSNIRTHARSGPAPTFTSRRIPDERVRSDAEPLQRWNVNAAVLQDGTSTDSYSYPPPSLVERGDAQRLSSSRDRRFTSRASPYARPHVNTRLPSTTTAAAAGGGTITPRTTTASFVLPPSPSQRIPPFHHHRSYANPRNLSPPTHSVLDNMPRSSRLPSELDIHQHQYSAQSQLRPHHEPLLPRIQEVAWRHQPPPHFPQYRDNSAPPPPPPPVMDLQPTRHSPLLSITPVPPAHVRLRNAMPAAITTTTPPTTTAQDLSLVGQLCAKRNCYRQACPLYGEFCEFHKPSRLCKVPECRKCAKTGGFCIAHGGGRRCQSAGCAKSAKEGGLCIAHGGGKRCQAEGCEKAASSTSSLCLTHAGEQPQ